MTKTELLDRCARDREERVLLGRVLDKGELTRGFARNSTSSAWISVT